MAEIRVQEKRKPTPAWIWIVVALVILAVIAYFLLRNKNTGQTNTINKRDTTSFISSPASGYYV